MRRQRAFTLIELLVVVALVVIVITLAAPSFHNFVVNQRLKSINAQVVTDMQFARSEAASRSTLLRVVFASNADKTCYTLYATKFGSDVGYRCNCLLGPGAACDASSASEVRTVVIPTSSAVRVTLADPLIDGFAFDSVSGGLMDNPTDYGPTPIPDVVINASADSGRSLRTTINIAGRPTVCGNDAALGVPTC